MFLGGDSARCDEVKMRALCLQLSSLCMADALFRVRVSVTVRSGVESTPVGGYHLEVIPTLLKRTTSCHVRAQPSRLEKEETSVRYKYLHC